MSGLLAAQAATAPTPTPTPAPTVNGKPVELCAAPLSATPMTGPHLSLESRVHDFGTVQKGAKILHTFIVRNGGNQPLEIKEVQASCGCTTAGEWTRSIAPGETGKIPVQFDSTQFSGPVTKTVTVTSNCVRSPQTVLEIKGVVRTPVMVTNPVIIFPAASDPSKPETRTTTIRHEAEGALKLTDLASDNAAFKPSLKETVPGREFELAVSTVTPLGAGTHTGRITLKSSNPDVPVVTVQAVVTVLPPVQIAPTSVSFTQATITAPEKRYVVVLNHRGGDLKISDLETNAPGVTFTPQRSTDGKQFTIALTIPAGFNPKAEKLYFRGKTNHPAVPSFEVPFVYSGPR